MTFGRFSGNGENVDTRVRASVCAHIRAREWNVRSRGEGRGG